MTEKTTLEVGDKLYYSQYSTYSGPYTIERVTATQAISGETRFNRATNGVRAHEIGASSWSGSFFLETPEINLKVRQQILKDQIRHFEYSTLTLDQLERINAILTETQQP